MNPIGQFNNAFIQCITCTRWKGSVPFNWSTHNLRHNHGTCIWSSPAGTLLHPAARGRQTLEGVCCRVVQPSRLLLLLLLLLCAHLLVWTS
jgi:hypothetical protein